ncbi:MAG: glycosyltransferase [Thermoplasmata archaeon]|nr:glycosyltransferase [Thermoplasmata archaeon]
MSLSTGGGTKVLLKTAEILADDLHQEVTVAGYHSLPLDTLERLHSVELHRRGVRLHTASASTAYGMFRELPFKLSPYNLLLVPAFGRWVRRAIRETRPDIVWFHDDIPRAALPALGAARVFLYVHYPLLGRTSRVAPPLASTRSLLEKINDAALVGMSRRLVIGHPDPAPVEIWVNSTVTAKVVERTSGRVNQVVYPCVDRAPPSASAGEKQRLALAVGTLTQGKGYQLLIDAFANAGLDGWKLLLIGHSRDRSYVARLRKQIERCGLSGRGEIRTDASPAELEAAFQSASVIVNCASFEPFGVAFLEGMSHGAMPITLQSEFSGCWTDVCNRGEFGHGFRSVSELSRVLREFAGNGQLVTDAQAATARARFFSRGRLVEALARSVQ